MCYVKDFCTTVVCGKLSNVHINNVTYSNIQFYGRSSKFHQTGTVKEPLIISPNSSRFFRLQILQHHFMSLFLLVTRQYKYGRYRVYRSIQYTVESVELFEYDIMISDIRYDMIYYISYKSYIMQSDYNHINYVF